MAAANPTTIDLDYGSSGHFHCEIEGGRTLVTRRAPAPMPHFDDALRTALAHPLEFPPLSRCVVPGDSVVLAVDHGTPCLDRIVGEIWQALHGTGVEAEDVVVMEPANGAGADPRGLLPEDVRSRVRHVVHDPRDGGENAYLASSSSGDRVYLARELVDADVVVSVGPVEFDPLMGYRGTSSAFYPGLASEEAVHRALGQGHTELSPDDDRPLRQLVDEVGWLLGSLFTVQVVPAAHGGAAHVLAGETDTVFRLARHYLNEHWRIELPERPEVVVVAVDADAGGHGWKQVASAIAAGRSLVDRGGKIVVLSELVDDPGAGLELLSASDNPEDAIRPLREEAPADIVPATQIANAAVWADVYLLSGEDPDTVDDLFLFPLEHVEEVERLLDQADSCVFLESAQHVWGSVASD